MGTLLNFSACRQVSASVRREVVDSRWHNQSVMVPLLLDTYAGASAAYSIRKVRMLYNGSCIRIRRSSDSAEIDIGFLNGVLNTEAMLDFVGAGSAFVVTVYDQTGNGNNLTQGTALSQPRVVDAGVLVTKNGRPAINFLSTNWMQANIAGLSDATSLCNFAVITPIVASSPNGTSLHLLSYAGGGPDGANRGLTIGSLETGLLAGETFGAYFSSASINAGRLGSSTYSHTAGQQGVYSSIVLNTGIAVFRNNGSVTLNMTASGLATTTNMTPAADGSASNAFRINSVDAVSATCNELFQESIVYLADQSANRSSIESAINSFYSVY